MKQSKLGEFTLVDNKLRWFHHMTLERDPIPKAQLRWEIQSTEDLDNMISQVKYSVWDLTAIQEVARVATMLRNRVE